MAKKSTMRRGQMIAIAALFTSAVAPYAVSADTTGSVTTDAGTSRTLDAVTTTSTEVVNTAAVHIEKAVDYTVTAPMEGLADRLKAAMIGDVNLKIDADGKKYAQIAFVKSSYGFESFSDKNKQALTPISTTGEAGTTSLVRVIEVELDDKYQAIVNVNAPNFGGEHALTFDLAHEKFDFGFDSSLPDNNTYFKNWTPNADVVTLKDGKKVAYVTFAGHSYGIATLFEGSDNSKAATIVSSSGSAADKNLTRVIRLELDANNTASAYLDGGDRGSYTFTFDFTEKAPEVKFVTVADLSAEATALTVDFKSTNAAQFWLANIAKGGLIKPTAKAVNGKIEVTFETKDVKSLTITQNGVEVPVTLTNNKATFTVANLEGLTLNGVFSVANPSTGAVSDSAASVTLEKAQLAETEVTPAEPEKPTTKPDTNEIPKDRVAGKATSVSFTASASNDYFQKGGFFADKTGKVTVVEINGKTYADFEVVEKSVGMDYSYIIGGTTAKALVLESSGDTAENYKGVIRFPVTVDANDTFKFTLQAAGNQPGKESTTIDFTFNGKIQNNVELPFTDVKNGATKEYVQQLANWGALNLNNAKFNPGNDLTRAQFSLMIARVLDLKPTKATVFKDVAGLKDQETKDAIQALYEAGIVNGTTATTFSPSKKITRQQAARMLYRLMTEKLDYTATATVNDLNFNDAADIKAEEAKLAFAELQKAGIMSGNQGFINPSSNLTRGQMAKILVETLNKTGFDK